MIYLPFDFFSVTVQERWHRLSFMLAETSKGDAEDCTVFHLFLGTDTHLYWVIHTTSTASLYELHTGLSCVWGFNLWLSGSLKLLAQARSHQTKGWTCPWVMRWPSAWEGLTTVEQVAVPDSLFLCDFAPQLPLSLSKTSWTGQVGCQAEGCCWSHRGRSHLNSEASEKKWETRSRATSLQGQHMKAPKVCPSQLLEFHPSKGRTIS